MNEFTFSIARWRAVSNKMADEAAWRAWAQNPVLAAAMPEHKPALPFLPPLQRRRVGTAARDANRRAALRGQSPAPAGQSLDDYPFACSAQGGCGATVRSVPVGEQSYQGGVLSRFFQDNGIGVGDPFNVMFGP